MHNLNFKKILVIFLFFKALDFTIIYIAHYSIPYLGFFSYKRELFSYNVTFLLTNLANFDGIHYLNIARTGYVQFEQAFFPLFPLAIRFLGIILGKNYLVVGIIISNVAFLVSLYLFFLILKEIKLSKSIIFWSLIFLLSFPTSFFFGAVYSESMFLALFLGSTYSLMKGRLIPAMLFAALASLTRLIGIFIIIPFVAILIDKNMLKNLKYSLPIILSPIAGLLAYALYLWKTSGDPLFFINSQPAFGANRSTHIVLLPQVLYRYIHIFSKMKRQFIYFIAGFEFFSFIIRFSVTTLYLYTLLKKKPYNLFLISLSIFSFINLILPSLTGTLSSTPRYALLSPVLFIAFAQVKKDIYKVTIFLIFTIFHIILLAFFSQGYFVS